MGFFVALLLMAITGGVCSYLALKFDNLVRSPWFRWGMPGVYCVLVVAVRGQVNIQTQADAYITVPSIAAASIFWGPCLAVCVVQVVGNLVRSALSLDGIRIPPGYSKAEGATARGDLNGAIRLYRQMALEHPDDPESWRRMAELHLTLGQPDEAIKAFGEAEAREKKPGNKLIMVFAIAEVLADVKDDVPGALGVIEEFLRQNPHLAGRSYAEERIRILRGRLSGK